MAPPRLLDRSVVRSAREAIVLAALIEAAAAGEPCPDNKTLAGLTGSKSSSGATDMIMALAARGLLKLERVSGARRVTIVATGQSTAALPAGRSAKLGGARRKYDKRLVDGSPDVGERLAHRPPERDPCFRCGVRGDVGCRHQPLAMQGVGL